MQRCAAARQRALKAQQKRRTKFSHAGPAISTRVRLDTPTVLVLSEDQVRSALEYRGSLARFDLQMSKEAASALALLFQQIGEPRPPQQHAAIGMSLGRPKGIARSSQHRQLSGTTTTKRSR